MKCNEVQKSLLFYLDNEMVPGDHQAMTRHLAECGACRQAQAALAATRSSVSRALQSLAVDVETPPLALSQLHSRLAKEARPSPAAPSLRSSRQAPGAERMHARYAIGEYLMRKRIMLPVTLAVIIIAFLAFFWARNATPVSAQQILDLASASQPLSQSAQGIEHIRTEGYMNVQADTGEQVVTKTIVESYFDRQSGKVRLVTTDAGSGQVRDASGYDGAFTYSTRQPGDGSSPLVIYRSPRPNASLDKKNVPPAEDPGQQARQVFDQFRSNPDVKLQGKQTQPDGRVVYVLRISQEVKIMVNNQVEHTPGFTSMVFDANTYAMLENRTTVQKDGKEVVVISIRYLANELLPAESAVAWDLSDLKGVSIVDDPKGENSDLLPETISPATLAANTSDGYLLETTPEGFELELTAPPKQDPVQPFIYIASYRNATSGDYFMIQTSASSLDLLGSGFNDETYRTATGLTLNFAKEMSMSESNGKQVTQAYVTAPDGTSFTVTSTLPRQLIKQLAEDLIATKG